MGSHCVFFDMDVLSCLTTEKVYIMIIADNLHHMLHFMEDECQLSIAEIALACGVSKQSIYRAKRGESVSSRVKMRDHGDLSCS